MLIVQGNQLVLKVKMVVIDELMGISYRVHISFICIKICGTFAQ